MVPAPKRTTSASAAKLRSLRIMLLSRSKRRKTRNNNNNNNNNNDSNMNMNNNELSLDVQMNTVKESVHEEGVAGISTNTRATSAKRANLNTNKSYHYKNYINYKNNKNNTNNNNNNNNINSKSNKKLIMNNNNNNNKRLDREQREKRSLAAKHNNKLLKSENQEAIENHVENAITLQQAVKKENEDAQAEQKPVAEKHEEARKLDKINNIELNQNTLTKSVTVTTTTTTTIIAAAAAATTTITTSTSPQPVKVFYDNRIKRKNVLALNEKVAAIREYEKMPVYKRIGRMFQCSPDQIKRIVQQKDSILKAWEQRTRRCQDAKTLEMKVVRVSMLGKAVFDWIRRMMYYKDFMISDGLIQKMALQFKSAMGLKNFFPHQDWCDKFRQTYKIFQYDSKLLNFGYTQGHSVQIKDIIKDVLSECTPDLLQSENNSETGVAPTAAKQFKLMPKPLKQERKSDENTHEQKDQLDGTQQKTKIRNLQLPQLMSLPRACGLGTHKVLVATPITTNKNAVNAQNCNANQALNGTAASPMTMTIIPLATITQPLGSAASNAGAQMPVAGSLIAANTKRQQGRCVPPPMVEIKCEIKEEHRDEEVETQLMQQQQHEEGKLKNAITTTTTSCATTTPATKTTTTLPVMPMAIKEELFSEEEEEEAVNEMSQQTKTKAAAVAPAAAAATTKFAQPRTNTNKSGGNTPTNGEEDTTDSLDYDNLALSSLKQIIQNKAAAAAAAQKHCSTTTTATTIITTTTTTVAAAAAAAAAATTTTMTSTKSTQAMPKLTLTPTPTLTLTPIENLRATPLPLPPMVALSQLACVPTPNAASSSPQQRHIAVISRSSTAHLPTMPPLALQQLPPLTKAPVRTATPNAQLPLPALIPRSVAAAGSLLNYRLPTKRKMRATSSPTPGQEPPIKSCSEARRYLKLLEDFALQRENVRLIGLITRADEVLRELDGDDDVDID